MSITMHDIANKAGVSQSTVSRALNDSSLIPDETKVMINKIAKELGYEFNANARSLITSKTGTIGLIYPSMSTDFSYNIHFSYWHNHLREKLEEENLDIIISFYKNKYTNNDNVKKLISGKKVDGLIIMQPLEVETISFLNKNETPYVFLKHLPEIENEKVSAVVVDHFKGGYKAGKHLLDLGHKNFITITADLNSEDEFRKRTQGFKTALKEQGITLKKDHIFKGDTSFESGYKIIKENISLFNKVTAVFAQNDLMALGTIRALQEEGRKVPEDVSVIGYDDVEFGKYFKPFLTTIHQPTQKSTTLACKQLISLLETERNPKEIKLIEPEIVIRESTSKNNR